MPLHVSSTVLLIIRRSKLYYKISCIITLKQVSGLKLLKQNFRPLTCFSVTIPVCGQNVELLNVKLAVHIVTTGL